MIGVYVRVSSEEQAQKGYSVRNQLDECKKKAGTNEVIEYVDEGYSGEFLERPALEKLRKDVREGIITKVVCYDPDRLSRKLMNALIIDDEFRKRGVEMVYVNGEYAHSPEGQLFYSMRGAISEFEKAKINERMSSGRRRKAREGKVVKNNYCYGYDYDKEKSQYVINEDEAKIVRLIFDLFTNPNDIAKGMNGIANYLTEKGVPTKRRAGVWHRQVVRQILMNRTYTGTLYQNRWNTEGMLANKYKKESGEKVPMKERDPSEWIPTKIPRIISDEQFEYAQDLLQQARRRWAKSGTHKYLLSGLVRCGKCGNTMTGVKRNTWGQKILKYTDRKNTAGAKHFGCGNELRASKLEDVVWKQIREILDNPEKIENHKVERETPNFELEQINILEKEIEKAKKGRKKLMQTFAMDDDLEADEMRELLIELKQKEDKLKEDLEKTKEKVAAVASRKNSEEALKKAVEIYVNNGSPAFEDKQKLLRTLIKEIIIYDEEDIEIVYF
ncbi:recombinase family protein [Halalkalibacterium halodurans]|uniref:recombinase family protein n=1 Tax=Halalkalibacterium halodurans TaxID=86665 RepID=UPI002E1E2D8D|nr:recombinase family protein [Halalkalibacterium halodurans]MED4083855.1 recombinase family protein [Halalkalibacterium halodurans]MED4105492.1 recombinase family protein [Halalkalibacterium halodurans]MED4109302.1 recombinase family protein [Halalkalibacterium halodurans]MED4149684.1 recombinase family protein [Halalkalibacterium halodurans]